MLARKSIFPNVIEMNFQAGQVLGCCVYLVYDGSDWLLIDIGLEETVEEIIELIRQMDFPLSKCKMLIATHADVDHIQGIGKAKQLLKAPVFAHPRAVAPLESGDRDRTFARIEPQKIDMPMPPFKIDGKLEDGDTIDLGSLKLDVWLTPGHTDSQLSFRLRDLLFSGDNIYRDGCV